MEVEEAKVDLFVPQPVESEVKLESHDDVKPEGHSTSEVDLELITSSSMWSFLLKRSKNVYQLKIGNDLDYAKMTRVLLDEVGQLLDEVSEFVRSCCYNHIPVPEIEHSTEECTNCLDLHQFLALGILGEKDKDFTTVGKPKVNNSEFTLHQNDYCNVHGADCKCVVVVTD